MQKMLVFCILYPSLLLGQPLGQQPEEAVKQQEQPRLAEVSSTPSDSQTIKVVQRFLRAGESRPSLKVTGTWNNETQDEVNAFLVHLQNHAVFGLPWRGPKDGRYSVQYATYLQQAVNQANSTDADPQDVTELADFARALNKLQRAGVYTISDSSTNSTETTAPDDTSRLGSSVWHDTILGPFLWFANGALSGFGDEIYCAAFRAPQTFSECHEDARDRLDDFAVRFHTIAIVLNLVGSAVNVFSLMLSLIAIETEWSGLAALILSFIAGTVDFVLYTIGDFWTWGWASLDFGQIIVMSLLSGFVMCWVVAIHRWKYKKPPIRVQFGGLLGRLL